MDIAMIHNYFSKMSGASNISELFVEFPNGKIFVKRWSPSEFRGGAPIVLLHDSLGCVEMWRDFPKQISERTGRIVIAYDRLGFGRSSERSELPSSRFVSEESEIYLPAILNTLGITRFVLMGHSVGGAMCLVGAGNLEKECEAVVTESAQVFVEDQTKNGILRAKSDFENAEKFAKLQKYHGEKTRWVLDAWIKVWLSDVFSGWSLKDDLPKVHCPVLIIHGDKDEYGSVRFPDMISDLAGGPVEKQIIANCGHVPHREQPELVLNLVVSFLSRL